MFKTCSTRTESTGVEDEMLDLAKIEVWGSSTPKNTQIKYLDVKLISFVLVFQRYSNISVLPFFRILCTHQFPFIRHNSRFGKSIHHFLV